MRTKPSQLRRGICGCGLGGCCLAGGPFCSGRCCVLTVSVRCRASCFPERSLQEMNGAPGKGAVRRELADYSAISPTCKRCALPFHRQRDLDCPDSCRPDGR